MGKVAFKAGIDPTLPDVTLEIGGKERQLAFDITSIITVEKLTGINLMDAVLGDVSITALRAVLFAALMKDDESLTLDQVGHWINHVNFGVIQQAIFAAWYGSLPKPVEGTDSKGEAEAQASPEA